MPCAPNVAGAARVRRVVRVGPHLEAAASGCCSCPAGARPRLDGDLVGPAEQGDQVGLLLELRRNGRDLADEGLARAAVHADPVAFLNRHAVCRHDAALEVDLQAGRADDAGPAELARDHGGVAGGATLGGEDALGGDHAVNVVGLGERADHDDRPFLRLLFGQVGVEVRAAHRGARGRVDALRQQLAFLRRPASWRPASNCGCSRELTLSGVTRMMASCLSIRPSFAMSTAILIADGRGALGVTGLEHPELAALDRELDILHVLVVLLEQLADVA